MLPLSRESRDAGAGPKERGPGGQNQADREAAIAQRQAQEQQFKQDAPAVGAQAPDITLNTTDGQQVSISDHYPNKPVVIEFGSITCPVFRGNIQSFERLKQMVGDAADLFVVYTIEAHPADVNSPYANRVWVPERNKQDNVLVNQPTTYEERLALAQRCISELGVTWTVLVDGMDDAVWEAYGKQPNSAIVIGTDGTIQDKQLWANARGLIEALGVRPNQPNGAQQGQPQDILSRLDTTGITIEQDVEYGNVDGDSLTLDAYLPEQGGPHPAIVHIHGGGWRNGDKSSYAVDAVTWAKAGVASFSLNYRLSTVATYPAAIDDCVAAVKFIRANSARFNIDIDRMAVRGGSAGGHLALMMAFLEPNADETNAAGQPIKNRFVCAATKNPPTDLSAADMAGEPALVAFMAGTVEEHSDDYRQGSPVTHVSVDDPPVLMMHGTEDRTVPYTQATLLEALLKQTGVPVELITVQGAGHGLRNGAPEAVRAALQRENDFIAEHLGVTAPPPRQPRGGQ